MARIPQGRKPKRAAHPGSGRPPLETHEEKRAVDESRRKLKAAFPEMVERLIEASKATRKIRGRGGHVMDEVPDWKAVLSAIQIAMNKGGMPDQKELKVDLTDSDKAGAWTDVLDSA